MEFIFFLEIIQGLFRVRKQVRFGRSALHKALFHFQSNTQTDDAKALDNYFDSFPSQADFVYFPDVVQAPKIAVDIVKDTIETLEVLYQYVRQAIHLE